MVNLRESVLNAKDVPEQLVDVPEWGGTFLVRGMTVKDRASYYSRITVNDKIDATLLNPELLIACVYDPETGRKVFEASDRDMLGSKSAQAAEKLTSVAMELSGIGAQAEQQAVQDLGETQTGGSV